MDRNHLGFEVESLLKENPSKKIVETDTNTLSRRKHNLYPESYFQGMLIMEGKRTERSGDSFILMLLDIKEAIKKQSFKLCRKKKKIKEIMEVLAATTREIDLKGWYKHEQIIGIIFTELNEAGTVSLEDKIRGGLDNALDKKLATKITISCISFPEKKEKTILRLQA